MYKLQVHVKIVDVKSSNSAVQVGIPRGNKTRDELLCLWTTGKMKKHIHYNVKQM